jgi:hypothetical protein
MIRNDPQAGLSCRFLLFLPSRQGTALIQGVSRDHDHSGHLVPVPTSTSGWLSLSRTSEARRHMNRFQCALHDSTQLRHRTARQSHPPQWSFAYVLVVVGGSRGDCWVCRCHDYSQWWNAFLVAGVLSGQSQ